MRRSYITASSIMGISEFDRFDGGLERAKNKYTWSTTITFGESEFSRSNVDPC